MQKHVSITSMCVTVIFFSLFLIIEKKAACFYFLLNVSVLLVCIYVNSSVSVNWCSIEFFPP